MTWATFYAGLVERNGVAGHGRYFIALAIGALIAGALSSKRGLMPLRMLVPVFGAVIAAVAIRDLRNLHALTDNAAAAFYVPGEGPGLYVVIAGTALMIASFLASPRIHAWRRVTTTTAAVAAALVAGITMLIAGAYGEYYLHFAAGGHAHDHAQTLHPAHLLTFGGASLLFATFSAFTYRLGTTRRRSVAQRSDDVRSRDV